MDTLKNEFDDYRILKQGFKYFYCIQVKTLLKLAKKELIVRWEQNREEDQQRVLEIREHQNSTLSVDGIISLAYLNGKLVCYDGNHRRSALSPKLSNVKILVSVMWECTNQTVEQEFDRLNKCVNVPRIYIDKSLTDLKSVFLCFVKKLETKYPTFVSPSGVCKKPNFNRDVLLDDMIAVYKLKVFKTLKPQDFIWLIKKTNKCYKKEALGFSKDDVSSKASEKCSTYGLWLFCKDRVLDRAYLKKVLKEYPPEL